MTEAHEPRPEFLSNLEWQIQTAYQRRDRFSVPVRRSGWEKARITALILGSVFFGAAGVLATEEVQEHKAQELLLAEVDAKIQMAELRLEVLRENLEEVEGHYQRGLVGEETLRALQVQVQDAESQILSLRLDQEEIRVSGENPRNDTSAPLVGGRDFVTERLEAQEVTLREKYGLAEERWVRAEELVEAGALPGESLAEATLALEEARYHLQMNQERRSIRGRFLAGGPSAEEAEREVKRARAERQLEIGKLALENALRRLQRAENLAQRGLVGESEVKKARLELLQAEIEVRLAQKRLDFLFISSGLPEPSVPGGH